MTDALRSQTQARIEKDLIEQDPDRLWIYGSLLSASMYSGSMYVLSLVSIL